MKIIAFQSETEYKEFEFNTLEEFDYCFLQAMRHARKVYIINTMLFEDMYILQLYSGKLTYQTILYKSGFEDLWFRWRKIVEEILKENTMNDIMNNVFTNEDNVNVSTKLYPVSDSKSLSFYGEQLSIEGMLGLDDYRWPSIIVQIDGKGLGFYVTKALGLLDDAGNLKAKYSSKDLGNVKITMEFKE